MRVSRPDRPILPRGTLSLDRLVKFYDFSQVNQAIADSIGGKAIKPVLRMPGAD